MNLEPKDKDGLWGYVDESNDWTIEPQFNNALDFFDGVACVLVCDKWGVIDVNGNFLIVPQFDDVDPRYGNGLIGIEINDKWGVIDTYANVYVVEPTFDDIENIDEKEVFKTAKIIRLRRAEAKTAATTKEIDWEERHFQICLALLGRTDVHSYHSGTVSSVDVSIPKVIKTADKMVEALKEHYGI